MGRSATFSRIPNSDILKIAGFGNIGIAANARGKLGERLAPFTDFILDLFKRRNDLLLTKDPRQTIYKLLMNSLYGKFAESGTRKEYTFKEGKLTLTDQKQGFTNNTNFLLAAYITAYARLRTHRLMAANDFEDILYVDTDGFLTTKHNYATAEGLGSLTDRTTDKPYALTTCIRPKFYILDDAITFRGFPQRISGNLLRAQILKGDVQTTFKQILGLRAAKVRRLRPLSEITTVKKFTLGEDLKREYAKHLDNRELISEFVSSQPLTLRES